MIEKQYKNKEIAITTEFSTPKLSVRPDLVINDKKELIIFELKSNKDNLNKLNNQINNYLTISNNINLIKF